MANGPPCPCHCLQAWGGRGTPTQNDSSPLIHLMSDLISLLQNLSNGLPIGSLSSLLGMGLTLIFRVMRTTNFSHGDFVVLGMYIAVLFSRLLGWDPYLSV